MPRKPAIPPGQQTGISARDIRHATTKSPAETRTGLSGGQTIGGSRKTAGKRRPGPSTDPSTAPAGKKRVNRAKRTKGSAI